MRNRLQRYRGFSPAELITPFDSLINELMNDSFMGLSKTLGEDFFVKGSYPKVNVLDLDKEILIEAAVPGLTKDDIEVEIKDDVLTISGKSNQEKGYSDSNFVRRELKRSRFQRSFALGATLDKDSISASCKDGVLRLSIPKVNPEKEILSSRVIDIS